jgi:hypothetical protein
MKNKIFPLAILAVAITAIYVIYAPQPANSTATAVASAAAAPSVPIAPNTSVVTAKETTDSITYTNISSLPTAGQTIIVSSKPDEKYTLQVSLTAHYDQGGKDGGPIEYNISTEHKLSSIQDAIDYLSKHNVSNIHIDSQASISDSSSLSKSYLLSAYDDHVVAGSGNVTLHGGDGNDILVGGSGADTIYGDAGNDSIQGGEGDDVIDGGQGNDFLSGDAGSNTYNFKAGDGQDIIISSSSKDSISINDVEKNVSIKTGVDKDKNNLIISYGKNDKITVMDFFTRSETVGTVHLSDKDFSNKDLKSDIK